MGAEKPLKVCQAHPAGLCDVFYLVNDGAVQLITCGADGKLCFRRVLAPVGQSSPPAPQQRHAIAHNNTRALRRAHGSPHPLQCGHAAPKKRGVSHCRSGDEPSKAQKVVDTAHRGGTPAPCTAITASHKYVAVGDVDNFVKVRWQRALQIPLCSPPLRSQDLHTSGLMKRFFTLCLVLLRNSKRLLPLQIFSMEGEYRDVATKFTLPVQAVAASPSGSTLAAGGDDEGIKLISTTDPTGFKVGADTHLAAAGAAKPSTHAWRFMVCSLDSLPGAAWEGQRGNLTCRPSWQSA